MRVSRMTRESPHHAALAPLLLLTSLATACDPSVDSDTWPAPDTGPIPNHMFVLTNESGSTNYTCATQLLAVALTPASGAEPITETFVLNPRDTLELDLTLSEEGDYRIEIFEEEGGPRITWDAFAMGFHGTTSCSVNGINTGFLENTYCNGIHADASTMVCGG